MNADATFRKDRRTGAAVQLQHRHFAFIAATIKALPTHAASLRAQQASVAVAFADACQRTNINFDRERFLRACGMEVES